MTTSSVDVRSLFRASGTQVRGGLSAELRRRGRLQPGRAVRTAVERAAVAHVAVRRAADRRRTRGGTAATATPPPPPPPSITRRVQFALLFFICFCFTRLLRPAPNLVPPPRVITPDPPSHYPAIDPSTPRPAAIYPARGMGGATINAFDPTPVHGARPA